MYSLILRDCQLTNQDLLCLAQADFEGWLPNLELLDISNNREMGKLQSLFAYDNRWENLKTLRTWVDKKDRRKDNQFDSLTKRVYAGSLNSLRELSFSVNHPDYFRNHTGACLKHLQTLEISGDLCCKTILKPIAERFEMEQLGHYSWKQKMFPKLDSVFVFGHNCIEKEAPEKQKPRKHGVNQGVCPYTSIP